MSSDGRTFDEPDGPVEDYEHDREVARASREREAGLTALGGPLFGAPLFPEGTGGCDEDFDARHNP